MAVVRRLITLLGYEVEESKIARADRAVRRYSHGAQAATLVTNRATSSFRRFSLGLIGVATAAMGVRRVFGELQEYERLQAQLETLTGSVRGARDAFNLIDTVARRTPNNIDQVTEAYSRMLAVGVQPTESMLVGLSNISASFGEDVFRMADAITGITAGLTRQLEHTMRTQATLTERPGYLVTYIKGVRHEVENNQQALFEFFERIGNVEFAGGSERMMRRLPGLLTNVIDSFKRWARAMGDAGLTRELRRFLQAVMDTTEGSQSMAELLGVVLAKGVGLLADAFEWAHRHATLFKVGLMSLFAVAASAAAARFLRMMATIVGLQGLAGAGGVISLVTGTAGGAGAVGAVGRAGGAGVGAGAAAGGLVGGAAPHALKRVGSRLGRLARGGGFLAAMTILADLGESATYLERRQLGKTVRRLPLFGGAFEELITHPEDFWAGETAGRVGAGMLQYLIQYPGRLARGVGRVYRGGADLDPHLVEMGIKDIRETAVPDFLETFLLLGGRISSQFVEGLVGSFFPGTQREMKQSELHRRVMAGLPLGGLMEISPMTGRMTAGGVTAWTEEELRGILREQWAEQAKWQTPPPHFWEWLARAEGAGKGMQVGEQVAVKVENIAIAIHTQAVAGVIQQELADVVRAEVYGALDEVADKVEGVFTVLE